MEIKKCPPLEEITRVKGDNTGCATSANNPPDKQAFCTAGGEGQVRFLRSNTTFLVRGEANNRQQKRLKNKIKSDIKIRVFNVFVKITCHLKNLDIIRAAI